MILDVVFIVDPFHELIWSRAAEDVQDKYPPVDKFLPCRKGYPGMVYAHSAWTEWRLDKA